MPWHMLEDCMLVHACGTTPVHGTVHALACAQNTRRISTTSGPNPGKGCCMGRRKCCDSPRSSPPPGAGVLPSTPVSMLALPSSRAALCAFSSAALVVDFGACDSRFWWGTHATWPVCRAWDSTACTVAACMAGIRAISSEHVSLDKNTAHHSTAHKRGIAHGNTGVVVAVVVNSNLTCVTKWLREQTLPRQ